MKMPTVFGDMSVFITEEVLFKDGYHLESVKPDVAYPFNKLKIGQSFCVPSAQLIPVMNGWQGCSILGLKKANYFPRIMDDGTIRVWRIS